MASDDSEAFELARHGRPAGMLRGRRAVGIAAAALAGR
jgi:hypothetical protein